MCYYFCLCKYSIHSRPVRFEQNTTCNSIRQVSASSSSLQIACRESLHAKNCQTAAAKGIPQILCTKMTSQNIANFFFFILLHGLQNYLSMGSIRMTAWIQAIIMLHSFIGVCQPLDFLNLTTQFVT